MLDKKISVSEQVANLSIEAQILFTWCIPHADDIGMLPYSARQIKAMVVPMFDWSVEDIGNHLESIRKQELIEVFEWGGESFWRLKSFASHQTLKKDRQPQILAKIPLKTNSKESWDVLEKMGFHLEYSGIQIE